MAMSSSSSIPRPSQQEIIILSLLWKKGPLTARMVMESMPDGKKRAYTSILSVLQVMEKKGFVNHESRSNTHYYKAIIPEAQVVRPLLRRLVQNLFGGDPAAAIQTLLQATDAGEEDLKELNRVIKAYKNENPKEGKS